MPEDCSRLCVAILTGGQSTRMGVDKALLPWNGGDLLDRAVHIASEIRDSQRTLIIGDRPEYHGRGAPVIEDRYPNKGPIGGIATALHACQSERVLVVAVDMPLLSPELLNAMCSFRFEGDALVPRTVRHSNDDELELTPQTLHAIYRSSYLAVLEERIAGGKLKIADAFDDLDIVYLDPDWLSRRDPGLRSFENANTPEVFQRMKKEWEAARRVHP